MADDLLHLAEWQRDVATATLRALVDQRPGWTDYTMQLAIEIAGMCERFGIEPAPMVRDGVCLWAANSMRTEEAKP